MAVYRLRIFIIAAAIATSLLLLFGAYSQNVITPQNVSDLTKNIAAHVPGTGSGSSTAKTGNGVSSSSSSGKKNAYMTLLTNTMDAPEDPVQDHYFMATRILGYQLLHQPNTRTQRGYPFVVLVTADVKQDRRDLLTSDGAIVLPVQNLEYNTTRIHGEMPQWKDVMTKLRAWELVEYDLIAFLDGDFILNRCMDGIFDDGATMPATLLTSNTLPSDEGELPSTYVLATVAEANPFHNYPPTAAAHDYKDPNYFNAGFFLFRPDLTLFRHFEKILQLEGRFDPQYPEQNLLNYAFRRSGQMPWIEMDGNWHIRFPTVGDMEQGVASMHDKWWSAHMDKGLQPYYDSIRWRMEGFYEVTSKKQWELAFE
ncbi:nucleotide-diphospho-sugar transferase [Aureobasidium pullulans]|nr:nucleotide-diphospho-sugar transferase [Aureobasidium pullulans]